MEHHASKLPGSDDLAGGHFAALYSRGNAPVSYFIILSGFVMSFAYGERQFDAGARSSFMIKRFGRVGLSYYFSLLLVYVVDGLRVPETWTGYNMFPRPSLGSPTKALLPTLIMSQAAFSKFGPINATCWTVSTLAVLWLAYPFLQPRLRSASSASLFGLIVGCIPICWAFALISANTVVPGPLEEWFWPGYGAVGVGDMLLSDVIHISPIAHAPAFMMGLAAGLLCRRGVGKAWRWWGAVATLALLAVPGVASVPSSVISLGVMGGCEPVDAVKPLPVGMIAGRCAGRVAFYEAIPAPLFTLFIFGSCTAVTRASSSAGPGGANGGGGALAAAARRRRGCGPVIDFLASPVVAGLGSVSFQVYLFQEGVVRAFDMLCERVPRLDGTPRVMSERNGVLHLPRDSPHQAVYFVVFLLVLWTTAAAFVAYVENPAMERLQRWQASLTVEGSGALAKSTNRVATAAGLSYWLAAVAHTSWLLWNVAYNVVYYEPGTC